jgi:predicted ATPase
MDAVDLHILTGAPGSGKTAILDGVGADIRCVGEPAREVLPEQRSAGGAGTPDRDPWLFVDLLLRRSIDKQEAAQRWGGAT